MRNCDQICRWIQNGGRRAKGRQLCPLQYHTQQPGETSHVETPAAAAAAAAMCVYWCICPREQTTTWREPIEQRTDEQTGKWIMDCLPLWDVFIYPIFQCVNFTQQSVKPHIKLLFESSHASVAWYTYSSLTKGHNTWVKTVSPGIAFVLFDIRRYFFEKKSCEWFMNKSFLLNIECAEL